MNSTPQKPHQTVARYKGFFETVRPETLAAVVPLISEDVRFVDPFNDVHGRDAFVSVFQKMFEGRAGSEVRHARRSLGR